MDKRNLDDIRQDIDSVDRHLVELLNKRYGLVHEVGEWKKGHDKVYYIPEREKALLNRLGTYNQGPMTDTILRSVYREIMSGALYLEQPLRIAYLGPLNTFSHQAAMEKFGRSVSYEPCLSISDVFDCVAKGKADYGVVPIENSTEGAVTYTLDMFATTDLKICAEMYLKAHQNLLSKSKPEDIKVIYSHPQALAQCRNYLLKNFPNAAQMETRSTAEAARRAAEEEGTAAVATLLAAEAYGLNTLESCIEDSSRNITRFLILGKQNPVPTADDKTAIMFAMKDRVGALYECLACFDKAGISMTMIESRPSRYRAGEYLFFCDFVGHIDDEACKKVVSELGPHCHTVKVLGAYPRGSEQE